MTKSEARNPKQVRMTKSEKCSGREETDGGDSSESDAATKDPISARDGRDVRPQSPRLRLEAKVVIGFVRPDPEPGNHVTFTVLRWRGSARRSAPHKCCCAVLRSSMTDGASPSSRARISRALVSGRLRVAHRNASRIDDWFCRSRQILQAPSTNVFARFLGDGR